MSWTPEEVEQLRALLKEGRLTATEIGRKLGKTRSAIIGKVYRLKLALPGCLSPEARASRTFRTPRVEAVRRPVQVPVLPKVPREPPPPETPPVARPASARPRVALFKDCQWYHGSPRDGDFSKCCNPVYAQSPYCEDHYQRVYQPIQPRRNT